MTKHHENYNWQQDYRERLLSEIKILVKEAMNCAQLPSLEKIFSLAVIRLEMQSIFPQPPQECLSWYSNVMELCYLNPLLADSEINELIFFSSSNIQIHRQAKSAENITIATIHEEDFLLSLQILCVRYGVSWNYAEPFASFTFSFNHQTYRATAIHPSIGQDQKARFFLRRIRSAIHPLEDFDCDTEQLILLKKLISDKSNILIAGATGTGKTAFLSSLLSHIPSDQHIVTLEDTDEIICHSPSVTKLLSNNQKNKTLSDYMSYAMRMSPERIILGEMRSHEVIPFILATNTGHRGLMATIHANCAREAIDRVATLFAVYNQSVDMAHRHILNLITRNIDYVIFLKNKKIEEIIRPMGHEGDHLIYIEEYTRH